MVLESFAPSGAHGLHTKSPGRCPGLHSAAAPRLWSDALCEVNFTSHFASLLGCRAKLARSNPASFVL